jgi:hypothetical protein
MVKRGIKDERWEVIEVLYGGAALSDLPPVKPIASELDIPERTASDWDPEGTRHGVACRDDFERRAAGRRMTGPAAVLASATQDINCRTLTLLNAARPSGAPVGAGRKVDARCREAEPSRASARRAR